MKKILILGLLAVASLQADIKELYVAAVKVQKNAYCPYSNYYVGCALEASSGKIYTGCNIENASWSVSICSERTALVKALSEGERSFKRLVIVTKYGGMSCGICRQMLNEFSPDLEIITFNVDGKVVVREKLRDMLPKAFGPESLQELPETHH